jgi:O-antigen/teichoic acid export membrane protein
MLPLYTHYFSPEEFGYWDITITTITLLIPFITFELTAATYRWLLDTTAQQERIRIISSGFFQIVTHMAIANILAILIFINITLPLKWEALIVLNALVISGFLQQCARGIGRNKLFAAMGILQTGLVVSLNLLFILYFRLGIEAFFYATMIAGMVVIVFAWIRMGFSQFIRFSKRSKQFGEIIFTMPSQSFPLSQAGGS